MVNREEGVLDGEILNDKCEKDNLLSGKRTGHSLLLVAALSPSFPTSNMAPPRVCSQNPNLMLGSAL